VQSIDHTWTTIIMSESCADSNNHIPEKARFCKKCCDYLPIAEFSVTDTINPNICKKHDDFLAKTTRWCKTCNEFMNLNLFRKTGGDFLCKKHMYLQMGRKYRAKQLTDPMKAGMLTIRNICSKDSKTFKQVSIGLSSDEIRKITMHVNAEDLATIALLPVDPTRQMSLDNVIVVHRKKRDKMIKVFKENDQEKYAEMANKEKLRQSA